jgi:hypothetical protein
VVDVGGMNCVWTGTGAGRRGVVATVEAAFAGRVEGFITGDDFTLAEGGAT